MDAGGAIGKIGHGIRIGMQSSGGNLLIFNIYCTPLQDQI
jgi:hypothetical protein